MINYLNRLYTNDIFNQLEQYNKMENKNDNKSKSNKNTKKSNEIEKIDVKLNKNIDKNKEENIKKKGKLDIDLDNKKELLGIQFRFGTALDDHQSPRLVQLIE